MVRIQPPVLSQSTTGVERSLKKNQVQGLSFASAGKGSNPCKLAQAELDASQYFERVYLRVHTTVCNRLDSGKDNVKFESSPRSYATVAQLVEQSTCNAQAMGSSPFCGSYGRKDM